MKAIKILMVLFMGLSFTSLISSCSSDEEGNGGGNFSGEKKLVEIKIISDNGEIDEWWQFDYNSKGQLMSATETEIEDEGNDINITSYSWDDNYIIQQEEGEESIMYSINDNLIRTGNSSDEDYGCNYVFTYNSSKQLKTFKHSHSGYYSDTETYSITWTNDKISKIELADGSYSKTINMSYDGKTCKGFLPLLTELLDDEFLFYTHPELIGMKSNQLPNKISIEWENYPSDYVINTITYILDDNGYVESCSIYNVGEEDGYSYSDTYVYKFKWE